MIVSDIKTVMDTVITQPAQHNLGKSPEGSIVRDLQGTFRVLSEDRYKNVWFVIYLWNCILEAKVLV